MPIASIYQQLLAIVSTDICWFTFDRRYSLIRKTEVSTHSVMSAASWQISSADPASFSSQQLLGCVVFAWSRIHSTVALPAQAVHKSKCINGIALSLCRLEARNWVFKAQKEGFFSCWSRTYTNILIDWLIDWFTIITL